MVDADVLIDILRGYSPALEWLTPIAMQNLMVPGFVAMELVTGCRSALELQKVDLVLSSTRVVWPSADGLNAAQRLHTQLHLSHRIGQFDALIAATAMDYDKPLFTFNLKHYSAVSGLRTVQPYRH